MDRRGMEYILRFRVFRSDEGWRWGIEFVGTTLRNPGDPDEHVSQYAYVSEQRATTAGLRALSVAIGKQRKAAPVKVMR